MVGKIVIFMILFLNQISELELFYQVELYFISCLFPLKYSHYKKGRIKAWFFFPLIYQFSEKWVLCHMTNEFVFVFVFNILCILFQLIMVIVILMLKFSCLWLVEALSNGLLCPNSRVLWYHLSFLAQSIFQTFLEFFLCCCWNQELSFSKKPCFLSLRNNWNHSVGTRVLIAIGRTHFSK